jgi:predicted house-cleaning NTP pyrophosphatase (Maf/HAM1 superfamily)
MATKKAAPKKVAKKTAAPKRAAQKAPKAPADKFIVVRDDCTNVCSGKLQTKVDAVADAKECARDSQEPHTLYKVVGVQRFSVPTNLIVEDL